MAEWNPKIVSVPDNVGVISSVGQRFEMTFSMSGKTRKSLAEVRTFEPFTHLVIRHHFTETLHPTSCDEEYELVAVEGGTRIRQRITFGKGTIPWFWRAVIWFITRFGRPVGETYLEALRTLVENSTGRK